MAEPTAASNMRYVAMQVGARESKDPVFMEEARQRMERYMVRMYPEVDVESFKWQYEGLVVTLFATEATSCR